MSVAKLTCMRIQRGKRKKEKGLRMQRHVLCFL
jgi:hypothetical protein